jgi:hypothetical protein
LLFHRSTGERAAIVQVPRSMKETSISPEKFKINTQMLKQSAMKIRFLNQENIDWVKNVGV